MQFFTQIISRLLDLLAKEAIDELTYLSSRYDQIFHILKSTAATPEDLAARMEFVGGTSSEREGLKRLCSWVDNP